MQEWSKYIDELSMVKDKKLPNLKVPAQGKKGVSKFMRRKAIASTPKEGKAYGPTGISYYVPTGHKDEVDPKTKEKYPERQKPDYKPPTAVKKEATRLDPKCWDGYKKAGTKMKGGVRVNNCVKEDDMKGMSVSSGHKRPTDSGAGMTAKGVAAYRRKNPGSKLKTAVTTPPSKLKKGSKAANRRKSFCARSRSWTGERGKAARRRWNC